MMRNLLTLLAALAVLSSLGQAFVKQQPYHHVQSRTRSETRSSSHHWMAPPAQPAVGAGGFHQQQQQLTRRPSASLRRTRFRGGSSVRSPPEQPLGTEGFYHHRQIPRPSIFHDILLFTNIERRRHDLGELGYNSELAKAAQHHAECMANNGYFNHIGFDGSDPAERVKYLTNYHYQRVGENLFWRTPDNNPRAAVDGWMKSPGHRKNVLNREFTEIGLGYATDGHNHFYVQVFGRPVTAPTVKGTGETRSTLFRLTNQVRRDSQLPRLRPSDMLSHAAQEQAEDMLRRRSTLGANIRADNYGYHMVADTSAYLEPFNDPRSVMDSWMEQEPVYMLKDQYTDVGIGYATNGESHYYVQLLGARAPSALARRARPRQPRHHARSPPRHEDDDWHYRPGKPRIRQRGGFYPELAQHSSRARGWVEQEHGSYPMFRQHQQYGDHYHFHCDQERSLRHDWDPPEHGLALRSVVPLW